MSEWLFGPDSMMWRINRESVLLLGGRTALLMQLAHPAVAAGVAQHSNFKGDPFGRLKRTVDTMLSVVFGTRADAERVVGGVNALHERVRGSTEDGSPYRASDPRLLLWVYSTLVYSSVKTYEMFVQRLSAAELDRYYDETKVIATMFGIPGGVLPSTLDGLWASIDERVASGEVVVGPLARDLAGPILSPFPFVPRRVAAATALVTAALLPPAIRSGYGLKLGVGRGLALASGRRATKTLLPRIPGLLRTFPAARSAERRSA